MQGESSGCFAGGAELGGFAIEEIAADGVADGVELDADLVFAARLQGALHVREFAAAAACDEFVVEDGDLAFAEVFGGGNGPGHGVFEEEIFEACFRFFGNAVDDGVIAARDGVIKKLFFEGGDSIDISGEDEEAGGVFVESMDEVHLGLLIRALGEIGEDFQGGGALFFFVGGGQEAGGFVDDEDVGVLIEDAEAFIEDVGFHGDGGGVDDFDFVFGFDDLFEGFGGHAVEVDAFVGDHVAQGGFLGLREFFGEPVGEGNSGDIGRSICHGSIIREMGRRRYGAAWWRRGGGGCYGLWVMGYGLICAGLLALAGRRGEGFG